MSVHRGTGSSGNSLIGSGSTPPRLGTCSCRWGVDKLRCGAGALAREKICIRAWLQPRRSIGEFDERAR